MAKGEDKDPVELTAEDTREEASPLTRMQRAIIDNSPDRKVSVNAIARDCLIVAEAMVEEAVTNARENNRRDMDEMRKAFNVEAGEAKAQIEKLVGQIEAENERANGLEIESTYMRELADRAATERDEANEKAAGLEETIVAGESIVADHSAKIQELTAELTDAKALAALHNGERQREAARRDADIKTYVDAINNKGVIVGERDRTIANMQLAQNMSTQLVKNAESKLTEAGHARRALCETIETLANIIRNS